jgi:hypothetical protein
VQAAARCLEIPEWMFDRAACFGLAQAESPRMDRAALDRLKTLILEGFGTPTGAMIEARPRSLPLEGEVDATPGSPSSCPATQSVSTRHPDTGVAPTAREGARESPELNPVENVWQFMRDNWLSNRVFKSTTISSIIAVKHGTNWSISPSVSCPSDCANGRTGSDQ